MTAFLSFVAKCFDTGGGSIHDASLPTSSRTCQAQRESLTFARSLRAEPDFRRGNPCLCQPLRNHGLPHYARNDASLPTSSRTCQAQRESLTFARSLRAEPDFRRGNPCLLTNIARTMDCHAALAMTPYQLRHCEESSTWQSMPLSTVVRTMDCRAALAMTPYQLRHCEESSTRQSMPFNKHCENHGLPRCARNDVYGDSSSRITHHITHHASHITHHTSRFLISPTPAP
jgi:hypothetical protein